MERTDKQLDTDRPSQPALLAFVATTWFAQLPLIVGWNAMLEGGDPGVGLGWVTWLAVLASPAFGWAFAKNISALGVEHAQKPALAAAILVGSFWLGGIYVHVTGAWWLAQCKVANNADACLAAGNYFDSGDAAFQGTIDAKKLWAQACEGGGEDGWKACRKIVHRVGYRKLACNSLRDHCNADNRMIGACWDWGVVCDRASFVDEEVDELANKPADGGPSEVSDRSENERRLPDRDEQLDDYRSCLQTPADGVTPACDRTLDRGVFHQRDAVCTKLRAACATNGDWPCEFSLTRCEILAASPFE